MKVLVACEESQAVCIAFRKLGHEAYSCDTQECSGGHPEWHIKGDVLPLINGNKPFITMDGDLHAIVGTWDLLIAFPPCTYLTNAGSVRLRIKGEINKERMEKAVEAKAFFMKFLEADCQKICVETPTPGKSTSCRNIPKRYNRGGSDTLTRSGLACGLKTSPPLTPTDIIREGVTPYVNGGCKDAHGNYRRFQGRNERDPKTRSKTFPGVAQAMARQWGGDMSG